MILAKSLKSQELIDLNAVEDLGSFYARVTYIFNHHSFLNYIVLPIAGDVRLVKFTTLNQPYNRPEYYSIILRTSKLDFDLMNQIRDIKDISLNHLPYASRDINQLYNFPTLKSDFSLTDTQLTQEPLNSKFPVPSIKEAAIVLGLRYQSDVEVHSDGLYLIKFKLEFMSIDEVGFKRLSSPILNLKDILNSSRNGNSNGSHLSRVI